MKLERPDLDALHDVIFSVLDFDLKSDAEIMVYWNMLPRDLKLDIEKYGASDTPTRDAIYVWLKENIKLE